MSAPEPSLFCVFLSGGLGAAAGYLLRKVQKYEDRRDEIYLHFMPSLNYSVSSFMEAIDIFLYDYQYIPFIEKIKTINVKLEQQRLSGEILFIKESGSSKESFRKKLFDFSRDLGRFQAGLEKKAKEQNASDKIKFIIEEDERIGGINRSKLQKDAEEIQDMIESKIREFRSLYLLLVLVIIIFTLGAAGTVVEYFKDLT